MIEHWMHLRCAGIRQAQYTDTWACHFHNLILVYICIPDGALVYIGRKDDGIEEKKCLKVLLIVEDREKAFHESHSSIIGGHFGMTTTI